MIIRLDRNNNLTNRIWDRLDLLLSKISYISKFRTYLNTNYYLLEAEVTLFNFSKAQKSKVAKLKIKYRLISFFRYSQNSPQRVCISSPTVQSTLLLDGSWKTSKKGHSSIHQDQLSVVSRLCSLWHSNFNKRVFGH